MSGTHARCGKNRSIERGVSILKRMFSQATPGVRLVLGTR